MGAHVQNQSPRGVLRQPCAAVAVEEAVATDLDTLPGEEAEVESFPEAVKAKSCSVELIAKRIATADAAD